MVPPSKRASGDDAAPPSRRQRVTPTAGPDPSNPAPPPSPGKRFLAIVLVVLFFKRPKDRSTDSSVPVSLSRIRRLEVEIDRLRHGLGQVRETIGALLRKQDSINKLIRALSSKLDTIKGPSPNHHNHEHLIREGTHQEGTSAEAARSAKTETDAKDTNVRLRFCNGMKPPVYHDDDIKSIKLEILDGDRRIESGPLSKLKIEVLALEGNFPYNPQDSWTSKEFDDHIAYGRDGKGNVLAGKGTNAQLINGECHLGSIRFRESSCRARSGKFIIAARVRGSQAIFDRVQEAVMNPVVVLDRRNKYHEKSHPPKPDDEVYRLEKIAVNGKYHKRLEENNIRTVEHFSKALYKDEDNLARILKIKKKCKDWEKMVRHAQECCLQGKPELKSYRCDQGNVVLFFNYVHRFVGATFGGTYIVPDMFDPVQKNLVDKLKKNAYDKLDGLTGDHVMKGNIPVRISMDTDGGAGAGPSSMTNCAPQQINSRHHIAEHQVGGTPASEVFSPCVPRVPNTIPEPNNSTYNYQDANDGPSTSFSVSYLTTQNYQGNLADQGIGFAAQQQQHFPVVDGMPQEARAFLQHQADNNPWGYDTLEASAHINMDTWPQLFNNTGATSWPNDVTMGSSGSAQQEWSQCQGNMPGDTPF